MALPTGDNELYYYDVTQPEGNRYTQITTGNVEIVNSNLLSTGYASKYGDGIGYFNIPIEHLGGAVKTEDGKSLILPNALQVHSVSYATMLILST